MLPSPTTKLAPGAASAASALLLAVILLLCSADFGATREETAPLLSTGKTVLGQAFSYPVGAPAKVTAAIVTMQPGEETGWHKHGVPLFGLMLEGELTVDYGAEGTRMFRKGEALMEAAGIAHNGRNTGAGAARILAVFMGAEGVPDTVMLKDGTAPPQ